MTVMTNTKQNSMITRKISSPIEKTKRKATEHPTTATKLHVRSQEKALKK